MREVEAYRLFGHSAGVIHSVGYSIATERGADEGAKTVYVLLPYYRRGNLQDLINANLVNHARFPEKRLMQLFLGVCRALRDMHIYTGAGAGGGAVENGERMEMRANGGTEGERDAAGGRGAGRGKRSKGNKAERAVIAAQGADEDDESEQQRPLMGGEDGGGAPGGGGGGSGGGDTRSYAHRDIKPGISAPTTSL